MPTVTIIIQLKSVFPLQFTPNLRACLLRDFNAYQNSHLNMQNRLNGSSVCLFFKAVKEIILRNCKRKMVSGNYIYELHKCVSPPLHPTPLSQILSKSAEEMQVRLHVTMPILQLGKTECMKVSWQASGTARIETRFHTSQSVSSVHKTANLKGKSGFCIFLLVLKAAAFQPAI